MDTGKYTFQRLARMALYELSSEEQAAVLEKIAALVALPLSEWPTLGVRKLPGEPSLYLLPVDDSLRVFVRAPNGGQTEILDLVRRERLEWFAEARA